MAEDAIRPSEVLPSHKFINEYRKETMLYAIRGFIPSTVICVLQITVDDSLNASHSLKKHLFYLPLKLFICCRFLCFMELCIWAASCKRHMQCSQFNQASRLEWDRCPFLARFGMVGIVGKRNTTSGLEPWCLIDRHEISLETSLFLFCSFSSLILSILSTFNPNKQTGFPLNIHHMNFISDLKLFPSSQDSGTSYIIWFDSMMRTY